MKPAPAMKVAHRSAIAGAIWALLAAGPTLAAGVRLPALPGGTASVRLVLAADHQTQVLGFAGPDWATAYQGLKLDTAQTVTLTPTADIALAGGGATCYKIMVTASGGRGGDYCVQIPDDAGTHDLADLVGAAAIDPASLTGGRLLPVTTGAAPGWGLVLDADLVATWSATAGGGCTTLACLSDGPAALGAAGQVLAV
ncbi:MAG: hypothetical protein RLZZ524_1388, partial [Pseudomonadota bacterium]